MNKKDNLNISKNVFKINVTNSLRMMRKYRLSKQDIKELEIKFSSFIFKPKHE